MDLLIISLFLLSIFGSVLCFCLYLRNRVAQNNIVDNQEINVLDVLDSIQKIYPVGFSRGWELLQSENGSSRCWRRSFPSKVLDETVIIHGSCTIVRTSSLAVMRLVANPTHWREWKPGLMQNYRTKRLNGSTQLIDKYVMRSAEITNKSNEVCYYRFSHLVEDGLSWVLFWDATKVDWAFFLVQPSKRYEIDECLLTYMHGSLQSGASALSHTSVISHIKDAAEITSTLVTAERFLPPLSNHRKSTAVECCSSGHSDSSLKHDSDQTEPTPHAINVSIKLVPCFSNGSIAVQNLKSFAIHFDKPRKSLQSHSTRSRTKSLRYSVSSSISSQEIAQGNETVQRRHKSRNSDKENETLNPNVRGNGIFSSQSRHESEQSIVLGSSLESAFGNIKPKYASYSENKRRNSMITIAGESLSSEFCLVKKRYASEMNLHLEKTPNSMKESFVLYHNLGKYEEEEEEQEKNSSPEEKEIGRGAQEDSIAGSSFQEDDIALANSDFEVLLPQLTHSEHWLAEIKTKGNYGASELQAEVLSAAYVNLQSSIEDQTISSGGWSFHSSYKGIVLLSKTGCAMGSLKTVSYMCCIDIPMKPSSVWRVIKNPRSRFICDDMVKKVRILEELSSDQKFVYVYYETSHLLRKGVVDFCVLHTERQERHKYYLVLQSIEYSNCPLSEEANRETLLPSGFVVEAEPSNQESTQLTYLYQVIVSSPNSSFFQELSTTIPHSISRLRDYLMIKPK